MKSKNNLFSRIMAKLQDKKGDFEQHGLDDNPEEDMRHPMTDTGAQLGNGMRAMQNLKDKMMPEHEEGSPEEEASETPEEEAAESDDDQSTEDEPDDNTDEMPPSAGKHLFPKGHGLKIMIALAQSKKNRR